MLKSSEGDFQDEEWTPNQSKHESDSDEQPARKTLAGYASKQHIVA